MRWVRFNGVPGRPRITTEPELHPPKRVITRHDAHGNPRLETVRGWHPGDVVAFTASKAQQLGRDPANEGSDFALLWVETQNLLYDPGQRLKPPPFESFVTDPRLTPPRPRKQRSKRSTSRRTTASTQEKSS